MIKFLKIEFDSKRIFGLDILRALAILFVVFEHGGNFLPSNVKSIYKVFIIDGVSIFFVLSGFLIGKILIDLIEKNHINRKILLHFWTRRWFRTLPNYFFVLILLILLNLIFNNQFSFKSITSYFIFAQNIITEHPIFFPEAWSLSIEEWFYILIPICIYITIRYFKFSPRRSVIMAAVSILITVTLYRFYKFSNYQIISYGDWDLQFRKQVLTRLDSIMYGIIGAYFYVYSQSKWKKYRKKLLFLGLLLFLSLKFLGFLNLKPVDGLFNCVFSFSLTAIATTLTLPYLSSLKQGRGIWYSTFTYISLISYSMYLLNLSVIQFWIIDKIDWSYFNFNSNTLMTFKYGLFWFLTILFSTILYKYFETPMMNLRDRFKGLTTVS